MAILSLRLLSIMTRSIITYSTLRFSKTLNMALTILSSNVPGHTISLTLCIMTSCIITLGIIRFIILALSIVGFSGQHVKMRLSILWSEYVHAFGFFNEPDTLDSSSMLIYSELLAGLYTQ